MGTNGSNAILIGWINKGKKADCGETMKNQLLIQRLEELGTHVRQLDFKNWKRRPWVLAQTAWTLLTHRSETLILSTSAENIYPLLRLMKAIGWRQNIVHWVIGGTLGDRTEGGVYDAGVIGFADHTLVESELMAGKLRRAGLRGVRQLPNFKPIDYLPERSRKAGEGGMRFVFLSRIRPEKGCDYIFEAMRRLNASGLTDRYTVDFYGRIDATYEGAVEAAEKEIPNFRYKGFLNLREKEGYDTLAGYDMMLFPTFWKGEGFAGIFIDAFIAGLPIIATDWAHNTQVLTDGETARIIPVHSPEALARAMEECIKGELDTAAMSECCRREAMKYDVRNVVTPSLLHDLGIGRPN